MTHPVLVGENLPKSGGRTVQQHICQRYSKSDLALHACLLPQGEEGGTSDEGNVPDWHHHGRNNGERTSRDERSPDPAALKAGSSAFGHGN